MKTSVIVIITITDQSIAEIAFENDGRERFFLIYIQERLCNFINLKYHLQI